MNERIREFAEQTGYIWHASGDPQVYEFTPEKLEKFAELIIQECASLADKHNQQKLYEDYTLGVGKAIKKHFGVE